MIAPLFAALFASQLDALPEQISARWRVEDRREERPFRTGRTDEEIFDRERGVVFVYAATVARSREDAEQERARAAIFSAIYAYDLEAKWSERVAWKSFNSWRGLTEHWMSPLPHAANIDPLGFADARGRASPRWDLAAFAARYFTHDTQTKCRLLAQSRFLTDRLLELGANAAHPTCPAFDRWAVVDGIDHLEIDLASPTAQTIGSLFGHLFLRVDDDKDRVIAFLAESRGVLEDDPFYPLKGIFGGYHAALFEKSFLDTYRDYVIAESRHIRRWKLNLSVEEKTRVLEFVWTRLHSAHYDYYFFAQNCATLLLEVFNGLMSDDRALVAQGSLGRGPSSALDALASATTARGTPLLEYIAEPFMSYKGEALRAQAERRPISRRISELSPELAASIEVIESAEDPRQRAPAYDRVAPVLSDAARIDRSDAETWLRASAAIEAHRSAQENIEEEAELAKKRRAGAVALVDAYRESLPLELGAIVEPALVLTDDDDEATRFAGYRAIAELLKTLPDHQASSLRLYTIARADLAYDLIKQVDPALHAALFQPDPSKSVLEQDFVKGYERIVERASVTKISAALLAVQRAKQATFAARPLAHGDPGRPARIAIEEARYEKSYGHTGIDALSIAGAYDTRGVFGVVIRGAAYEETFGEQRRHGFPSTTSFTFLESEALWTWSEGDHPKVAKSDSRFIGYRSVGEARVFGFELYADLSTRHTDLSPSAGAGVLWSIASSEDFADHVIASAGVAYDATFPKGGDDVHAIAAPVALEARKSLDGPLHALKGSFSARPRFDLFEQKLGLLLRGDAELRLLVAERADFLIAHDVGVSLVARARWERAAADELSFDLGVTFD